MLRRMGFRSGDGVRMERDSCYLWPVASRVSHGDAVGWSSIPATRQFLSALLPPVSPRAFLELDLNAPAE